MIRCLVTGHSNYIYFQRITIVGQLAIAASDNFAASQMIYAAVTIGTNGAFVATRGQVFAL
jgi:hypothetical protein